MSSFDDIAHNAAKEITDKTEQFLRLQVAMRGITLDEFIRDYVLEKYPIEYSVSDGLTDDTTIKFRTKVRVRLKTDAEHGIEVGAN